MNKAKRQAVIAGNWKMNKTPKEAKVLLEEIIPVAKDAGCEVIACVPYVDLATALETVEGTNVKIGAENCHWAESGAFTGEISTGMLKEMGVIKLDLYDVSAEDAKKTIIAYEPVWAIGTGKTATADQAEEVCAFIRAELAKKYDDETAQAITIQYGGSMNDANAAELLSKENVDGGLIGGASLVAAKFGAIIDAATKG